MAVSLDMDLTRMHLTNIQQEFRDLLKSGDIDKLKTFLEENDRIISTNMYDKALQYAMASDKNLLVALLSEMKGYQASTTTLKLAASLNYHHAFNVMLNNRTDMNHKKEISTLLVAALESENIECVEKLQQMRQEKILGLGRIDEIDGYLSGSYIFQKQTVIAAELSGSHNSLRSAHDRINWYKICANPLYIILYELDPIRAAIETSKELISLAHRFPANKIEFTNISESCKQLPVDLLDCCEDDEEVNDLLNLGESSGISRHGRLWNMMGEEFIQFVTHPSCQYWLYSKWCGDLLPLWENFSFTRKMLHIGIHFILFPVYSIRYAIVPPPPEKKVPINSFIYSLSAYLCFLILLLYCIFHDTVFHHYDSITDADAAFQTPDYAVALWVITSMLHTINDAFCVPYPSYWQSWWTRYNLFSLVLFLCAGLSNLIASTGLIKSVPDSYFYLLAEGVYAIAITISFIKILHWFHTSSILGPVIISFSRMTNIILKLMIIFIIVLFSFSFGLYRLFRYFRIKHILYSKDQANATLDYDEEQAVFINYISTLKVLFWVIFGYGEPTNIEIEIPGKEEEGEVEMKQHFIMIIGYTMWALFHIAFVIVLLNMLIAIMTTSYEAITVNSDMNWKFARTRLWMYFMEDHNTVPPPFNMLYYLSTLVRFLLKKITCESKDSKRQNGKKKCITEKETSMKYQETLLILIDRYESKKFENSVLKDQRHIERVSYVEARKRLVKDKIEAEITQF